MITWLTSMTLNSADRATLTWSISWAPSDSIRNSIRFRRSEAPHPLHFGRERDTGLRQDLRLHEVHQPHHVLRGRPTQVHDPVRVPGGDLRLTDLVSLEAHLLDERARVSTLGVGEDRAEVRLRQ